MLLGCLLFPFLGNAAENDVSNNNKVTIRTRTDFDENKNKLGSEATAELQAALIAYKGNNIELALSHANKVVELEPEKAKGYVLRGELFAENKDLESAIIDFEKAASIEPKNQDYNMKASLYFHKLRNVPKALEYCEKVISINPTHVDALINASNFYTKLNNYDAAIKCANKIMEVDPEVMTAYSLRGEANYRGKKYPEAYKDMKLFIAAMEKGIEGRAALGVSNKNDVLCTSYFIMAEICEKLNKVPEAINNYTKLLEIDSKHLRSIIGRAICYKYLKKYPEAIADYNKAIELEPKNPVVLSLCYDQRALYNIQMKNYKEAIKGAKEFLDILEEFKHSSLYKSRHWEILNKLTYAYMELGQYDEAMQSIDASLADCRDCINVDTKGELLERMGRHEEAEKYYLEAIDIAPSEYIKKETIKHLERNRKAMSKLKK